jgi:hypothetical protein
MGNKIEKSLAALKELNGSFVLSRRSKRLECAKIPSLSGLGIFFARVKTIFAGFEFSNHGVRFP